MDHRAAITAVKCEATAYLYAIEGYLRDKQMKVDVSNAKSF